MNVQKIFDALEEDQQNSAWGIICRELEAEGYSVIISGKEASSDGFFNGEYPDIKSDMNPLNVSLMTGSVLEQEFSIEFTDFHEITIRPKIKP